MMRFDKDNYTENKHSTRRRRNLDLSECKNTRNEAAVDIGTGIQWDENSMKKQVDLEDDNLIDSEDDEYSDLEDDECDYEEIEIEIEVESEEDDMEDTEDENIESIELDNDIDLEEIEIGGKKLNIEKFKSIKEKDKKQKVTVYLDRNLVMIMDILKDRKINNYSELVGKALQQYFTE